LDKVSKVHLDGRSLQTLERYGDLVDDWDAFIRTLERPLPTCIWANPLRVEAADLFGGLREAGLHVRQLEWFRRAAVLDGCPRPGTRKEFLMGLYHVQEEAALVAVEALDPQPGERILDLCAAPGNKSALIGAITFNSGTVICNDRDYRRMRAVRRTLDRLGVWASSLTQYDGRSFPTTAGNFDRVLVDVPCSCEGTSRKNFRALSHDVSFDYRSLAGVQRCLLERAFEVCRPGGRVVYSTCTYAPEENEVVVQAVMDSVPDIELIPVRPPGFEVAPGLTEWKGQVFDNGMERAARVWPHHNDTGGFFVAAFEKGGYEPEDSVGSRQRCPTLDTERRGEYLGPIIERFGLNPLLFENLSLVDFSTKYVSITSSELQPTLRPKEQAIGMPFLRKKMVVPKLTTSAALAFGDAASRHVVDVSGAEGDRLWKGETIRLREGDLTRCSSDGYVLVRHKERTIGVGFLRYDAGGAGLKSLVPKAWHVGPDVKVFHD
jgi:NOL1/NOP2/sun family putative RNA methylase